MNGMEGSFVLSHMSSSKPHSLRRPALGLLLAAILSCATFLLGSCSDESASSPDTTVDPSIASFYMQGCWDPDSLTVERQTQEADLIIVGEIVQVDPSAWNSPDGKQWQPPEEVTLPIVYTTFYIKPTRVLKGEPRWGVPVAFRVTGPIAPPADNALGLSSRLSMGVGDKIVAFGGLEDRYGPGGVYKPAEAYWLTMEENSIWTEQDGNYVNKGHTKYEEERSLPLSALEAQIRKYVAAVSAAPMTVSGDSVIERPQSKRLFAATWGGGAPDGRVILPDARPSSLRSPQPARPLLFRIGGHNGGRA